MDSYDLSIIIPVFNEESCIEKTLERIINYMIGKRISYQIIVADDGSTDRTKEIVYSLSVKYNSVPIKFISHNIHKGKGFAVNIGMKEASGEYSLFLDADLSTDISEIEKFVPYIQQGKDVIIGTRRTKGSKVEIRQSFIREFMGRVFTWLSNFILGTSITDFTCGFKCFSKKAKEQIFSLQKITGWSYDAEILFLANRLGYKVYEVPIIWKNDPTTKVNLFRDTIYSFIELLKIRFINKYQI